MGGSATQKASRRSEFILDPREGQQERKALEGEAGDKKKPIAKKLLTDQAANFSTCPKDVYS